MVWLLNDKYKLYSDCITTLEHIRSNFLQIEQNFSKAHTLIPVAEVGLHLNSIISGMNSQMETARVTLKLSESALSALHQCAFNYPENKFSSKDKENREKEDSYYGSRRHYMWGNLLYMQSANKNMQEYLTLLQSFTNKTELTTLAESSKKLFEETLSQFQKLSSDQKKEINVGYMVPLQKTFLTLMKKVEEDAIGEVKKLKIVLESQKLCFDHQIESMNTIEEHIEQGIEISQENNNLISFGSFFGK